MRATNISIILACVALALCALADESQAQRGFFKSSPGSLSKSHANLDDQSRCNACHSGGKDVDDDKCLDCHDHRDLRKRIRAGEGYHASPKARRYQCENCHLEHRGRSFDIMGWDAVGGRKGFNHSLAGWKLRGKHAAAECDDCHKRRNRQGLRVYLGESRVCGNCHSGDQPHGFSSKRMIACDLCHTENAGKPGRSPLKFDHNARGKASMALEGRHAELACTKCHEKARFDLGMKDSSDCAHCHESTHKDKLFETKPCTTCHSPKRKRMADARFSHKPPLAKFRLVGSHRKAKCDSCHTSKLGKRKPSQACEAAGCHGKKNPHKDRFEDFGGTPSRCNFCHRSSNWKARAFRHTKRTKFKLEGKHARVDCRDCHRGKKRPFTFERLDRTAGCTGCHAHENTHDGKFRRKTARAERKECLKCHTAVGSRRLTKVAVELVHGPKSEWPLINEHKGVDCASCHPDGSFGEQSSECGESCHQDSLHRGRLGKKCSTCHEAGDWAAPRFDHSLSNKWQLEGWHRQIESCDQCHPGRRFKDTPTNCSAGACHGSDDIHQGKLGTGCSECHRPTGENTFDHNRQAGFALRGAHQRTPCTECHSDVSFEPRAKECAGCHDEPEEHRGRYGKNCVGCHNESSFADIRALHDVGEFDLGGAHDTIDCTNCHVDSRPLRGTGNLCITCHRGDDVHSNGLSPRCGTCHSQWAWVPASFDHSSVGCTPMGLHRTLPCADCHKNGNYAATSAQCYSCHRDEGLRVASPDHASLFDCGACHNTSYWSNGSGTGPAHGRESICW